MDNLQRTYACCGAAAYTDYTNYDSFLLKSCFKADAFDNNSGDESQDSESHAETEEIAFVSFQNASTADLNPSGCFLAIYKGYIYRGFFHVIIAAVAMIAYEVTNLYE